MKVIDVWRVSHWDDGARAYYFAHYLSRNLGLSKEAILAAEPKHSTVDAEVLVIFDNMEEVEQAKTLEVRRRAWDKLNSLERKALGMLERP